MSRRAARKSRLANVAARFSSEEEDDDALIGGGGANSGGFRYLSSDDGYSSSDDDDEEARLRLSTTLKKVDFLCGVMHVSHRYHDL